MILNLSYNLKILEKYYIQDVLYYTITYNNGYKLQDDSEKITSCLLY